MKRTGRERTLNALLRHPIDRIPVMEMGIDYKVIRGLGYRDFTDLVRNLDLDGITVNQLLYEISWRRWVMPRLSHYKNEWGVKCRFAGELLPVPIEHPIADSSDLDKYKPPKPRRSPLLKALSFARKRFPDKALAVAIRNDFAAAWYLCGMERIMMAFIDNPEFVHRLIQMVSKYSIELVHLCIEGGADVIYFTDDYAYKTGTLMSRQHFEQFILPGLAAGVDAVHRAGGICIKHSDGDLSSILDLIVDTGVDALGPLEPESGNNLVDLQQTWGHRIALVGNIDVDLLSRGNRADVVSSTENLVNGMGNQGGFVLSSGNTVTSSVEPENFLAMIYTGRSIEPG